MIKVLLFGTLAKQAGLREIEIEARPEGRKLSDIIDEVKRDYIKGEAGVYMCAVNEVQAAPEEIINDGDEVAIMPPFSGG
ncbi:MAG: MoaD/ThiS family protein [Thermodesulfobacteriota bacterium]